VFLGNSRSESDKFSLVVWIPSAAPRIDFLALRVARRELQYTSSAGSVSRRLKSFQTRLTSAHAEKEEDVNECVACDADLGDG
jgi:hypothetical protein